LSNVLKTSQVDKIPPIYKMKKVRRKRKLVWKFEIGDRLNYFPLSDFHTVF